MVKLKGFTEESQEMCKFQIRFCFEDEICAIGSQLDGQNLFDLIDWSDEGRGIRFAYSVPRVGEIVEMDAIWFEVLEVKYKINLYNQRTSVLLRQISLQDKRTKW